MSCGNTHSPSIQAQAGTILALYRTQRYAAMGRVEYARIGCRCDPCVHSLPHFHDVRGVLSRRARRPRRIPDINHPFGAAAPIA